MTSIKIIKNKESFRSIECDGHTAYGASGEDIVCAAASSLVQTAALGMLNVAHIAPLLKRDDKRGYFKMEIPDDANELRMHDAQVIFATMLCGLQDLAGEYSDFIELEVQDVY